MQEGVFLRPLCVLGPARVAADRCVNKQNREALSGPRPLYLCHLPCAPGPCVLLLSPFSEVETYTEPGSDLFSLGTGPAGPWCHFPGLRLTVRETETPVILKR